MIANDTATRVTGNTLTLRRGRVAIIVLWVAQVALAVMFLMAGGSKLVGVPAMVSLFDALGVGQWFRYVTGVIEVASGIALLVPSAAVFGAMLLIPTMLGAVAANLFLGQSPAVPLVLLLVAAAVAGSHPGAVHALRSARSVVATAFALGVLSIAVFGAFTALVAEEPA